MSDDSNTVHEEEARPYRYNRALKMQALPGSEYYLYQMLRRALHLDSLREVCILGMRALYSIGHDPALQPLLLNLLKQLREDKPMIDIGGKINREYEDIDLSR